ncbi:MAG: hypothetical protein IKM33_06310 [Clostridia bacterium]|nr:hypothetical protein [Clostridia bacterium]
MNEHIHEALPVKIARITVKSVGLLLVFGTIIFFIWRAFFSTIIPAELRSLAPNPALKEAYETALAEGKELTVFYQESQYDTTTVRDKNYSYFSAKEARFIQEADQVQLLFRYNNATIRHLVEDYGLAEIPDRSAELYDVTLYVAYDLTPDDVTDNAGNNPDSVRFVRYHATSSTPATTLLYNYRRMTFDGLDMTVTDNPVLAVYVDVYYLGDVNYETEPYGTICIYDYAAENTYGTLDKKEIAALDEVP